jgi:hypothetical protein
MRNAGAVRKIAVQPMRGSGLLSHCAAKGCAWSAHRGQRDRRADREAGELDDELHHVDRCGAAETAGDKVRGHHQRGEQASGLAREPAGCRQHFAGADDLA